MGFKSIVAIFFLTFSGLVVAGALEEGEKALEAKDYTTAAKWLRQAAEQGNAKAQMHLSALYGQGRGGLPLDDAEAMRWAHKSAEQGYPAGEMYLGILYDAGLSTKKNPEEAARWFRKAAMNGHGMAQFTLGIAYATGRGVEQSKAEALHWLRKAEEQGLDAARIAIRQITTPTPSK